MKTKRTAYENQKGAVIALVAVMIPVFLAGLGLAIDAGAMYEQNRRMQTAADSAALAAAQEVRTLNTSKYESAALYAALNNGFERDETTGIEVRNPAFDVTPSHLVTAIITEYGVVREDYTTGLKALLNKRNRNELQQPQ